MEIVSRRLMGIYTTVRRCEQDEEIEVSSFIIHETPYQFIKSSAKKQDNPSTPYVLLHAVTYNTR